MQDYITLQASFLLDEREQKAFAELLPYFWQYTAEDGSKPFEHWGIKDVFENVMTLGASPMISKRIKEAQFQAGMINALELINGKPFRLEEERKNDSGESGIAGEYK